MSEPERLEVEGSRRRPSWLVLLLVVAVLGGLLVVRLVSAEEPTPDTVRPPVSTSPTRSSPVATPVPWPSGRGLPSGTLYVLASGDVYSVDVASGLVEPMGLDRLDPDRANLTAMAPGVLVWSGYDQVRRRLWYAGAPVEQTLEPLRSAVSILPATGEQVWTTTQHQQEQRLLSGATWVLADDNGATGRQVRVRGLAVPDGAGGLLDVERTRVRLTGVGDGGRVVGTYVTATGPDGLMVDSCTASLCTPALRDRGSGRTFVIGPATPPTPDRATTIFTPGALSPGNRFLASSKSDQNGGFELRVSTATTPSVAIRTISVGNRSTDLTWLSDRWLVATSDDGLVLYDADEDTVTVPSLPLQKPLELVFESMS